MEGEKRVFQVSYEDNVATALCELFAGERAALTGDCREAYIEAATDIPAGHKIALLNLPSGTPVVKYGVPIGQTTETVLKGSWVHLHVMKSLYDERSSHLDVKTGAPKDTRYE